MVHTCLKHCEVIDSAISRNKAFDNYKLSTEEWEHQVYPLDALKTFNNAHLSASSSSQISSSNGLLIFHRVKSAVSKYQPGNAKYEAFRSPS